MKSKTSFSLYIYIAFLMVTFLILIICVSIGSVNIPFFDSFKIMLNSVMGKESDSNNMWKTIILFVRLPRVICVALVGAGLSICGVAMQGLLRNPLADGFTLGISSGASLGAIIAIVFGLTIPSFLGYGTVTMAMIFAFLSLIFIINLAYKIDSSLSSNTIVLIGIVFNMLISSIINLLVTFAGERVKTVMFWLMGSLAGSNYLNVLTLAVGLTIFGTIILRYSLELNALAISEDNARHIGIDVKKIKIYILIAVSALIGICVSIGGIIGFVGLVIPHMTRMVVGPDHRKLLIAVAFAGASFLMIADLLSRIILRPIELPIGVITSFVGSFVFIYIFYKSRKAK